MPRRSCPVLLLALCAFAAPAFAQPYPAQIDLSWNDCVLGAYSVDLNNACTTNSGLATMFISFAPPGLVPLYEANAVVLDLQTTGSALSPWWHLESGGCRQNALSLNPDFTAGPFSCADFWQGQAVGGTAAFLPSGTVNSVRIKAIAAVPEQLGGPINNDRVWYAFKLNVSNVKSVGTGSCAGCLDGACIVLNNMALSQPAPVPDIILTSGPQQFVTYRGGAGPAAPCPQSTPNHRGTWGSLKSLYR